MAERVRNVQCAIRDWASNTGVIEQVDSNWMDCLGARVPNVLKFCEGEARVLFFRFSPNPKIDKKGDFRLEGIFGFGNC